MLLAVIIGSWRSGPGRFSMRLRILRLRWLRILRLRPRAFLLLRFRASWEIVGLTRKPPYSGIVRMCSYLHYSRISGGFRAFSEKSALSDHISRLVQG